MNLQDILNQMRHFICNIGQTTLQNEINCSSFEIPFNGKWQVIGESFMKYYDKPGTWVFDTENLINYHSTCGIWNSWLDILNICEASTTILWLKEKFPLGPSIEILSNHNLINNWFNIYIDNQQKSLQLLDILYLANKELFLLLLFVGIISKGSMCIDLLFIKRPQWWVAFCEKNFFLNIKNFNIALIKQYAIKGNFLAIKLLLSSVAFGYASGFYYIADTWISNLLLTEIPNISVLIENFKHIQLVIEHITNLPGEPTIYQWKSLFINEEERVKLWIEDNTSTGWKPLPLLSGEYNLFRESFKYLLTYSQEGGTFTNFNGYLEWIKTKNWSSPTTVIEFFEQLNAKFVEEHMMVEEEALQGDPNSIMNFNIEPSENNLPNNEIPAVNIAPEIENQIINNNLNIQAANNFMDPLQNLTITTTQNYSLLNFWKTLGAYFNIQNQPLEITNFETLNDESALTEGENPSSSSLIS